MPKRHRGVKSINRKFVMTEFKSQHSTVQYNEKSSGACPVIHIKIRSTVKLSRSIKLSNTLHN